MTILLSLIQVVTSREDARLYVSLYVHSSSLPSLIALGLTQAANTKLLIEMSRHAVHTAQAIVTPEKELERELLGVPRWHDGRQDVGLDCCDGAMCILRYVHRYGG